MSEDLFEDVMATKYKPNIIELTEEEARQGILEGEAFMVLEIQVIGMAEMDQEKASLIIDFLAACNQKALTSPRMKEKILSITDVCEGTVMGITP
jgi:hypothetical protein